MPDDQDPQIEEELQRRRWLEQQAQIQNEEDAERNTKRTEGGEVKRMGTGIFLTAMALMALAWVVDLLTGGTFGTILAWFINVGLYFMLRPYRKSMGQVRWFLNISLVADSIPFLDLIPIDIIALIFAFVKSRSHKVQQITSHIPH